MGWTSASGPKPADQLATAVERFLAQPTTKHQDLLEAAFNDYRRARDTIAPPPGAFC